MAIKSTLVLIATTLSLATAANGQNLIKNGDFETPVVATASYRTFANGGLLGGGWTIVGTDRNYPGPVAVVSGSFLKDGITFNAQSGNQYFDFGVPATPQASQSPQINGIEQFVATKSGSQYTLSFWVGAAWDPADLGSLSRVDVFVNGQLITAAAVSGTKGSIRQIWKQFSVTFVATSEKTEILFEAPTTAQTNNALDNVELVLVP